jgi:phosphoribosylcarboxyaminoimidazole (NCAIR) mutase
MDSTKILEQLAGIMGQGKTIEEMSNAGIAALNLLAQNENLTEAQKAEIKAESQKITEQLKEHNNVNNNW